MFHNLHDKINVRTDFFLHNVFVLYFFFIVSLLFVFYLAFQKEVLNVCVFILVGFITSFFSKNLVVVFFIALTFTFLFRVGYTMGFNLEGFTGELDDEENDKDEFLEEEEDNESQNHEINENEEKTPDETKTLTPTPTKKPTVPKLAAANSGDEDINKLQEQTKILLDTQNELIKNIESLTPFLKQAESFTESISKIMGSSGNGSKGKGKSAVENFATFA
jgi:hypothetical protein